jgi:type IV secretion system protein VirB5
MENLLAGTVRNYLPTDWPQIVTILQGGGGAFAGLAADLQSNLSANAVLPGAQLAALSADARTQLGTARAAVALLQAVSQEALSNTSNRFSALQQLINAIPTAQDAKGALDLQTRIAAEQGMLQNEQTKLQVLYQIALAQQWAVREQAQERTAAGHGAFATRFEPSPF